MAYSKRDYTTKEEREKEFINKATKPSKTNSFNINKITEYMSQPNIREFNAIVVDKSFSKIDITRKGRPQPFKSREECLNEIEGYFKLCYDYKVIPTISSMALYLGLNRDTLYDHVKNESSDFSDILKKAIDTCQSYQELPALDGTLSAPTWIFTAKNYFNMKDSQDVNISATNQPQINANTMDAIKEQISLENDPKIIDMK